MTQPSAPHLPWVGADPRGFTVILPKAVWNHASKHIPEFSNPALNLPAAPFAPVTRALAKPDMILDNPQTRGSTSHAGHERYYRLDGYCQPPHVVVVVRILRADEDVEGYPAKAGDRVAVTFFVRARAPSHGTQLWP